MKFTPVSQPHITFDAAVTTGKSRLVEYSTTRPDENVKQCYVPVSVGQILSVCCQFSHLASGSFVDLVVDGVIRDCYVHRAAKTLGIEFNFRTAHFLDGQSFRHSQLIVQPSRQTDLYIEGDAKLGTIELHVYTSGLLSESWSPRARPDFTEVKSYEDLHTPWNSFGIPPDCEIGLVKTGLLVQSQRKTLKRRLDALRPGAKPLAILRFVYRTEHCLSSAGIPFSKATEAVPFGFSSGVNADCRTADDHGPEFVEEYEMGTLPPASPTLFVPGITSVIRKRKREEEREEELERRVNYVAFGHSCPVSVRSKAIDHRRNLKALADEVNNLKKVARTTQQLAIESRRKLKGQVRDKAEHDDAYHQLMKEREIALAAIEKSNSEIEAYDAQLYGKKD